MSQEAQETLNRVRKIIIDQFGVEENLVTEKAHFIHDLGADSLDTVELVMAIEEEFDIRIPDEEAETISNLNQALDFINMKLNTSESKSKVS